MNTWHDDSIPFTKSKGNSKIAMMTQMTFGKVTQLCIVITATGSTSEGSNMIDGNFSNLIKPPVNVICSPAYQSPNIYIGRITDTGEFNIRVSKGIFSEGSISLGFCYLSK